MYHSAMRARLILSAQLFCLLGLLSALTSCASNEELQDRLDRRNDKYTNLQDRRQMRQDARQERTDAWFDRAMH